MKRTSGGIVVRRDAGAARILSLGLLVLVAVVLAAAQPARAAFGFASFSNQAQQSGGAEETQAGAHPYSATVSFSVNTVPHPLFGELTPDENAKDLVVDLPAGFVGDPTAVATCTTLQITLSRPSCPFNSQIGIVVVTFAYGFGPPSAQAYPVFNMLPGRGQLARFAFNPQAGTPVNIIASVRNESDLGIRARIADVPEGTPFSSTRLTLWGNPADPSHDAQRGGDFVCFDDPATNPGSCNGGGHPFSGKAKAFLSNPTFCGPPLDSTIIADSWQHPDVFASLDYTSASGPTGCDRLTFEPSISVKPDSTQADAPTGLTVNVSIPQSDNANGLATPTLRNAEVALPAGLSLNAGGADGLKGCTDAEVGLGSTAPVTCPAGSKIGDVDIATPLLAEHLTGPIYLGQSVPGKKFRIFLVAGNEDRGITIRLEGVLHLDPQTGLVDTTFESNPQLPFSNLRLHFKGGPRAPLATPQTCGVKTATAKLTPWADPNAAPVTASSSFTISRDGNGAPCPPRGFDPGFAAGLTKAVGGKAGSFTMTLTRKDYDQELGSVGVTLPKGVLAHIANVKTLCSRADAAAGTCGEASRVGSVTTGAGAGALPFFLPGRVYLTGPYKGGPFGLSIVVPAVAGPFDLGTVVVRAAIQVNRHTTQIRVVSDPLPTIVEGVPLRLRVVNVHVDRPRFTFAPTNCTASKVLGRIVSTAGAVAHVSSRFQVANCARLPFHPQIAFKVGGKGHTGHGASTPFTTVVRMSRGQANLSGVRVVLPLSLNALLDVVTNACTLDEFHAGHCAKARAGSAVAVTPVLKHALRGGVFFVKDPDKPAGSLPNLMVALRGQVDIDLTGKVKIPDGKRLATNFDTVPDAPITKFTLHLVSGKHGPLGVAENLCDIRGSKAQVGVTLRAQNGKVIHASKRLHVAGCKK